MHTSADGTVRMPGLEYDKAPNLNASTLSPGDLTHQVPQFQDQVAQLAGAFAEVVGDLCHRQPLTHRPHTPSIHSIRETTAARDQSRAAPRKRPTKAYPMMEGKSRKSGNSPPDLSPHRGRSTGPSACAAKQFSTPALGCATCALLKTSSPHTGCDPRKSICCNGQSMECPTPNRDRPHCPMRRVASRR